VLIGCGCAVPLALVTLLAAAVFFFQGKEHDKKSCLSNTKQLGTALMMYTQDYDETLPPAVQTAVSTVADACPDNRGPMILTTVYDELFPYMKSGKVLQCPTEPKAISLCKDLPAMIAPISSEKTLGDLKGVRPFGNFVYVSYAYNRSLLGVGGFEVTGVDMTSVFHDALGDPAGYPATLAAIQYPADTVTFYDGYIAGQPSLMVADARHLHTANVSYVDGHSKPFHMAKQDKGSFEVDKVTGRPINQYYIDHGPYRSSPGQQPNSAFDGIVTDPVCAADPRPSDDCIRK
jgi:prepilin-type processing-associated H-X9-DG protein